MPAMLIGFGNKARHGKDTACQAIVDYYYNIGIPAISVPFAGALRQETSDAIEAAGSIENLLSRPLPDGTVIPSWVTPDNNPSFDGYKFGKHPKLLQWWGTEYRRAQDPDYWVKRAFEKADQCPGVVVISDMRFNNEFSAVKSRGGYTANVTRLDEVGLRFVAPDRDPNHVSETELDGADWDFFLRTKNGHVDLLRAQAVALARYIEFHLLRKD